jgi:uncharacterized membrane protein YgdD (TMEM256/DUF423 family)
MYDLITSSLLFIALVPGVILSVGTGITAAIIHGVVFYVVQRFISQYVPWWIIWAVVIVAVGWKFFGGTPSTSPLGY